MIGLDVIGFLFLQEVGFDVSGLVWIGVDILLALFALAVAVILIAKFRRRRHQDSD